MFWRFGLNNVSALDTLLDKEDVSLELILDEDDLLQECKSQNTRLIDYFQRVDVLQRLFAYVSGQIEGEDNGRFKYPHVATEVLCSELWCIVETCMNQQDRTLAPFWETVLDIPPEEMKTRTTLGGNFAKINAVFMTKKPAEMLAFIKSQPDVVERLLRHIETSAFVDLLIRMIQLDEQPGGAGVLEWLAAENFMGRLIQLLSPSHTPEIHSIVSELIKGIISLAAPAPGAEGMHSGFVSNLFARNLVSKESITALSGYITYHFGPCDIWSEQEDSTQDMLANASSVVHSISVFTELIRKNNSDYFEPYIFHLLRQRLIQVAQQVSHDPETAREALEQSMKEVVDRMGVVHLGDLLEQMTEHLQVLQGYLKAPRSVNGAASTTVGVVVPLTFERYRICELLAELLHCSNMSLLNRSSEYDHLYDVEGRLQGGLTGLEELGNAISSNPVRSSDNAEQGEDELEPALELPVTGSSHSSSMVDSDEDMDEPEPGSSDSDAMEEIDMFDDVVSSSPSTTPVVDSLPHIQVNTQALLSASPVLSPITHSPDSLKSGSSHLRKSSIGSDSDLSTLGPRSSRRSTRRNTIDLVHSSQELPIGERLKRRFIDLNLMTTLLDLFFEFPWNNLLHSCIYDIIHQILVGVVDTGLNRELVISLFRDAKLVYRLMEGVKANDESESKPKGLRLGYMGHLTLLAEDIITHLERFPTDLRTTILQYTPIPEWEAYVSGTYAQTKEKDETPLGGGKPSLTQQPARAAVRWKQDDEFTSSPVGGPTLSNGSNSESRGEFKRATGPKPTRVSTADFGPPDMEDTHEDENRVSPQYLAQEIQTGDRFSSGDDDDDDDDGGWLSRSTTFDSFTLSDPPLSARHGERRPLSSSGFDDTFDPRGASKTTSSNSTTSKEENPFNGGDMDAFGPFADSQSFTFNNGSFSDDMDDSFDFGDFQSAGDSSGELTPTTGSWILDEAGLDTSVKSLDLNTQKEEGTKTQSGRLSPVVN